MGNKTASKTKGKAASVRVTTFRKKAGGAKELHFDNGGKLVGVQRKGATAPGKAKVFYGSHTPSALPLHDAGQALEEVAAAPAIEPQPIPLEHETELADKLVDEVADTGPDVKELCDNYGLKREELGRLTGFSLRALAEWASGKLPSQPARRRLQEVRRLLDALAEIVKRERIPKWLHQPNPAFGRLTPLQIIELGEIDRLWAMVYDLSSGQPA